MESSPYPADHLRVSAPKTSAAGVPAVANALRYAVSQAGVRRSALTLLDLNQREGIDRPGCAWPEPAQRHRNEYCENGARHVADEATTRRVTRSFFAEQSISGIATGAVVDLVSVRPDRSVRRAERFTVVSYPAARGSAAAYYPETNVLVPLDSVADISNTPTSKSVVIRLEPR